MLQFKVAAVNRNSLKRWWRRLAAVRKKIQNCKKPFLFADTILEINKRRFVMKFNRCAIVLVTVMTAASVFAGPRGHHHNRGPRHHGRHHHYSRHHHDAGVALAAGVVGLIAGAVMASDTPPPPPPVYVQPTQVVAPPQPVYVQQPQVVVNPQPVYVQPAQSVIVTEPAIVMPNSPNSVIVIP